jgi:hypothetical protein
MTTMRTRTTMTTMRTRTTMIDDLTAMSTGRRNHASSSTMRSQIEQDARVRRLVLIGALATFLAFFGVVVTDGYMDALDGGNIPVIQRIGEDDQRAVDVPRVRTRSS